MLFRSVLLGSNVAISLLRNVIHPKVRIPAFVAIIAGFTTVVQMLVKAFTPDIDKALGMVESTHTGEVPMHLRNAVTNSMQALGYGVGYKYAHDYENNYVSLQFLPDEIKDTTFYEPGKNKYENQIFDHIKRLKNNSEK